MKIQDRGFHFSSAAFLLVFCGLLVLDLVIYDGGVCTESAGSFGRDFAYSGGSKGDTFRQHWRQKCSRIDDLMLSGREDCCFKVEMILDETGGLNLCLCSESVLPYVKRRGKILTK